MGVLYVDESRGCRPGGATARPSSMRQTRNTPLLDAMGEPDLRALLRSSMGAKLPINSLGLTGGASASDTF
jgi:hypothetical protein